MEVDEVFQMLLAEHRTKFDLYTFRPERGNALHVAAKLGFTQTAKEILSQGYQSLLLEAATDGEKDWPLRLAVQNKKWSVVKVFLEALSCRQVLHCMGY